MPLIGLPHTVRATAAADSRRSLAAVLAIAMLSTASCVPDRREIAFEPVPRASWDTVGAAGQSVPENGYTLLVNGPTQGLFPASISVSRLALGGADGKAHVTDAHLLANPRNEFLQWNTAFDDQMAVSEVFPIAKRDLGGGDPEPELVLAAMNALGGRLGLIYAVNRLGPDETEMLGTLFETESGRALAAMHAQARTADTDDKDVFDTDSQAIVRKRFEQVVYTCVRKLIANDRPATVETPEGWVPDRPLRPAQWPPRF